MFSGLITLLVALVFLIIIGVFSLLQEMLTPGDTWRGYMYCQHCGYRWKSRRQTPPARCAKCGGKTIMPVLKRDERSYR